MNIKIISIILVSLLIPATIFAEGQFLQLDEFTGGEVYCFHRLEDGTLLMGTPGGVYKFNEDNDKWEWKPNGAGGFINDFVEVNGKVFAASQFLPGLYMSEDQGETWSIVGIYRGEFPTGYIREFEKITVGDKTIIYGAGIGGIIKSVDNGETWNVVGTNYFGIYHPIAISDDGDIYCGSGSSSAGMFRSTLSNDSVWEHYQAAFETGGYTRFEFLGNDTVFLIFNNTELDTYTLMYSTNDGAKDTWSKLQSPFGNDSANIRDIFIAQNKKVYVISGSGNIYLSGNGGIDWVSHTTNEPLPIKRESAELIEENGRYARVSTFIRNEALNSPNDDFPEGGFWVGAKSGAFKADSDGGRLKISVKNEGHKGYNVEDVWVDVEGGKYVIFNGGLWFAKNGVNEISVFITEIEEGSKIKKNPYTDGIIIVSKNKTLLYDSNGKVQENIGVLGEKEVTALELLSAEDKTTLFASTGKSGEVYATENFGANWKLYAKTEFTGISDIKFHGDYLNVSSSGDNRMCSIELNDPTNILYQTVSDGKYDGIDKLLVKDNIIYAQSWNAIYVKKPEQEFKELFKLDITSPQIMDFLISEIDLFILFFNGISTYNLETKEIKDIFKVETEVGRMLRMFFHVPSPNKSADLDDISLLIATENTGLWKYVSNAPTSTSEGFTFERSSAAYPNPFKEQVAIPVHLQQKESVHLSIYSINGQEIRILNNSTLMAGNHLFTWDGKDGNGHALKNGQYLYKVTIGDRNEVATLVLMK